MNVIPSPRPVRRAATDAILGLFLFVAFAFGLLGAPRLSEITTSGQANAAEMARIAAFTGPIAASSPVETAATRPAILVSARADFMADPGPSRTTAILLLAGVFAVLFAFNLAFFRHLRRAYTPPVQSRRVVQR
jgi:hypothetical protein